MQNLRRYPREATAVTELPVERKLSGHFGPVPFYLTREMFGGLPLELAGGEISDKIDAPVAAAHRHDVPEVYLLISPESAGAEIEVSVDGEVFELSAPGALYVPAGALHHFVTRRAMPGSYCFGVLLTDAL